MLSCVSSGVLQGCVHLSVQLNSIETCYVFPRGLHLGDPCSAVLAKHICQGMVTNLCSSLIMGSMRVMVLLAACGDYLHGRAPLGILVDLRFSHSLLDRVYARLVLHSTVRRETLSQYCRWHSSSGND